MSHTAEVAELVEVGRALSAASNVLHAAGEGAVQPAVALQEIRSILWPVVIGGDASGGRADHARLRVVMPPHHSAAG